MSESLFHRNFIIKEIFLDFCNRKFFSSPPILNVIYLQRIIRKATFIHFINPQGTHWNSRYCLTVEWVFTNKEEPSNVNLRTNKELHYFIGIKQVLKYSKKWQKQIWNNIFPKFFVLHEIWLTSKFFWLLWFHLVGLKIMIKFELLLSQSLEIRSNNLIISLLEIKQFPMKSVLELFCFYLSERVAKVFWTWLVASISVHSIFRQQGSFV